MAHFEVGKKVICVKSHSQGIIKSGQIFSLLAIKEPMCTKCNDSVLDVGLKGTVPVGERYWACPHNTILTSDGIWWLGSALFAPYDDSLSETTAEQLIEELENHLTPCDINTHVTQRQ